MSKLYSRIRNLLLPAAMLLAASTGASAQNTLAGNVEDATVMNGVTTEQLQAIFSKTKFNGEDFVVVVRQTSAGTPYLAVTAPSLPFTIYVAGVGEEYSGAGDGVYAGAMYFTYMNLPSFSGADAHLFNQQHKFAKLVPTQDNFVITAEQLAAGGVTEEAILNGLIPFFDGIAGILKAVTTETVSFNAAGSYARIEGETIVTPSGAFAASTKLKNGAPDAGLERLVESIADSVAR